MNHQELIDLVKKLRAKKKYGLNWEDENQKEKFDLTLINKFPILSEVKENFINDKKDLNPNLIIEGDNYFVLSLLKYTHLEKIDIIYIDPPYNTGNKDFKYNDVFVDAEDTFRHSKWLNFMERRLKISKELLVEDGVIFASIGFQEQAQLRLLMDDIFGELNFIGMISRVQKSGSAQGTHFAPSIDYVLCYAKNKDLVTAFSQPYTDKHIAGFKMSDESGKRYKPKELYQSSLDPMRGCVNQRYFSKAPDNSLIIPPGENFPLKFEDGEQIAPANKNDKVWRWSQKRYLQERENLIFKETKRSPLVNEEGIQSKWSVYTKQYLDEDSGSLPRDFISDFENSQGTAALKKLGLEFSFAKPVGLISHLIEITGKKDPLVLDFFAGSGTTGQAVIELNALDNGNRRFILVTNNEENICTEVCYPRIKKILKGYVDKTGQKTLGLGGSLRYFRTDFVEKSSNLDELKIRVAEHCNDLIRIREDNFQEFQSSTPEYSIYVKKNSAFALYNAFEPSKLAELRDALFNIAVEQRKLYLFAFDDDNLDKNILNAWNDVQIELIPQKIIEILGSIDV